MSSRTYVASRKLLAMDAGGREFMLTLAIGQPYEISPEEWACSVSMNGLHEQLGDSHGIDSWQAMQLAYQLIAQLLNYFIEDGGKLYWPESREPVFLSELTPHLRTKVEGPDNVA